MVRCLPATLPDEVNLAVQAWRERERSALYAFILKPDTSISRDLVSLACEDDCPEETENGCPAPHAQRIDVIVHSTGGNVEAAYKLVNGLRRHCLELRVFVPFLAKSAATLICLGGDSILFAPDAEIGPLDAQIPDPRHTNRYMSALEQFVAVDYLRQHGYEILDQFVRLILSRTRMHIEDILSHAVTYSTAMMQGLYAHVDPLDFGMAHRALSMGGEYGTRLMKRYGYRDRPDAQIEDILRRLTSGYPSHSFVIDQIEAAQELGLLAVPMTFVQSEASKLIAAGIEEAVGYFEEVEVSHEQPPPIPGEDDHPAGPEGGNGEPLAAVRASRPNGRRSRRVSPPR